jgi:endonuclease YncB( thermonuclease family)
MNGPDLTPDLNVFRVKNFAVIDGDTVRLHLDQRLHQTHDGVFRLANIDTPEKAGRGVPATEKKKGQEAKSFLSRLLLRYRGQLYARTTPIRRRTGQVEDKTGRYGRYLVTLWYYPNGKEQTIPMTIPVNINDALVENGHANRYDGGRKPDGEWTWLGKGQ